MSECCKTLYIISIFVEWLSWQFQKNQSTTAHALIKLYKNPTALQKSRVPVFKTSKFSAGKIGWVTFQKWILTLSRRRSLSYRHQFIDLLFKWLDWFLYDRDFPHERVKDMTENLTPSIFMKTCYDCFITEPIVVRKLKL